MKILALDPALSCGWAYKNGDSIASGTWDIRNKKDESGGMRLIRLRSKLNLVFDQGIDLVVFEATRAAQPGRMGAFVVQVEFQSVIKLWCELHELQYRGYSPGEIKKYATGKGNAKKDAMVHACIHKFGIQPVDDNHADAVALLMLAASEYGI